MLPKYTIYTELDAILDTRIGTLMLYSKEEAVKLLKSGEYFTRFSDWFKKPGSVPFDYDTEYKNRDLDTLQEARMTDCLYVLRGVIVEATTNSLQGTHARPDVFVNTYPYQLTEEERNEYAKVLSHLIEEDVDIKVGYINYKLLTPNRIRDEFAYMIMYNFNEWLDRHIEEFDKKSSSRIPDVTIVAPALLSAELPRTKEEMKDLMLDDLHPLVVVQKTLVSCFNLEFIDPKYFCIVDPTTHVQQTA